MEISMKDILLDKAKVSRSGSLSVQELSKMDISKMVGYDELLQCLNPATFDFTCVINNIDWAINSLLNNVYLSCSLGQATPDPGDSSRLVSSGVCLSWFGLPLLGQAQKCQNFDSASKALAACKTKCDSVGKPVEQSGCDGSTIYCWCK